MYSGLFDLDFWKCPVHDDIIGIMLKAKPSRGQRPSFQSPTNLQGKVAFHQSTIPPPLDPPEFQIQNLTVNQL